MNHHSQQAPQSKWVMCLVFAFSLALPSLVAAQEESPADLLAHWPMDGNGADVAGAFSGVLASRTGNPVPAAVAGRRGQALQFGSHAVLEVPINIDPVFRPVVTFSFWIKRLSGLSDKGIFHILTAGGDAPQVTMHNGRLRMKAGENAIYAEKVLTPDEWHFIAITWDRHAGAVTYFQDNREAHYDVGYSTRTPQPSHVSPRDPDAHLGSAAKKRYLWVGARDGFRFDNGANGVVIDDLHLFAGRASHEQLTELSDGWTDGKRPESTPFTGLKFFPGDMFEPQQFPGDMFEPQQFPGDMFEPQQFPGDMFEPGQDEDEMVRRDSDVEP